MARSPAPPGPPPPNYRPPGSPQSGPPSPFFGASTASDRAAVPQNQGLGAGAAVAIALVTLLIGLVIGFFVGRASEVDDSTSAAPPLTSPSTAPTTRPPGDTIPPDVPVDPEAPPSTHLDPTSLGTVDDPIPLGQAYVLGLYEIEVLGVERNASSTLRDFNGADVTPPDGNQHVLVEVAVRFTDAAGVGNPSAIPFFVSDGTATWNDFEATCGAVPNSILAEGLIEQGDEASGNTCFTVPTDVVDTLLLGTEGFSGPIYFALPE
jgi:hypothetical protein